METLVIFLVVVSVIVLGIFGGISGSRMQQEASNVDIISNLRAEISQLREKLQSIRLGTYKPTESEKYTLQNHKKRGTAASASAVACFFCDEPIERSALVCAHCRRVNVQNLEAALENDRTLSVGSSDV